MEFTGGADLWLHAAETKPKLPAWSRDASLRRAGQMGLEDNEGESQS